MKKSELFFAFLLLPVDIAMIIVAFILAYYLRIRWEIVPFSSDIGLRHYLIYCLYLLPFWVSFLALNWLYSIKRNVSFFREFYRIVNASSTAMILLVLVIFSAKITFFSRLILAFTWILSVLTITLGRAVVHGIQYYLLKFGIGQRNVLLVGDNETSKKIIDHLKAKKDRHYKIIGVLNNQSDSKFKLKIVGKISDLEEKIKEHKIDEVVLTDVDISKKEIIKLIRICSDQKVAFKYVPDIFSMVTMSAASQMIGTMPVMELKTIPLDGWGRIIKRIGDDVFSGLILAIISPILLIISILEKITSTGPIFYYHPRVGRDEQLFNCYKFRSMYTDAENKEKKYWTTANDNRITPLGKILRKTNIDELPQLWNIFRGDMSFVGPRPEQPRYVEKFEKEIPDYFKRHKVKAGLTGWAQVNGLKGDTSIEDRVRYDIYYIEHWSVWFDFKIVIKTFGLIIYEIFGGKIEYRSNS